MAEPPVPAGHGPNSRRHRSSASARTPFNRSRTDATSASAFDRFQEQACGVCDPIVSHRTIFDEHLHQSIRQGDLVGRLSAVFFGNPLERALKQVINMTRRELGTNS